MKILWVKAGGLVPPDVGGRIRSYHIAQGLAKRHSVTFFTFYAKHPGDVHDQLAHVFERAVCIPLPIPVSRGPREAFHFALHLLSPLPYSVAKHSRAEVQSAMRDLTRNNSYDLIICDFVIPGAVVPWNICCPKILFAHNVEAQIWNRRFRTVTHPIWKMVAWSEYRKMSRYERLCLRSADHVFTVSETDRNTFGALIDRKQITVIPTGVDTEYFRPCGETGRANELVFTGAMDWMPNEDAILYFANEILPLIRKSNPEATLTVVGRSPSRRLLNLAFADSRIRVTGRVDDVRPYVADASVFIVPLRIGGGTRLKIFEAMAMGKAIVSTPIGAEGLPVTPGKNIIIADNPRNFARSVVGLLNDRDQRENLGYSARQHVEAEHSWSAVSDVFNAALERIVYGYRNAGMSPNAQVTAGAF